LLAADGTFVEARAGALPFEVVETETLAQLERLRLLTGRSASHLDVHKHLHRHPQVLEGISRAALKRKLPLRSIDPGMRKLLKARGVLTNDSFVGDAGAKAYWTLEELHTQVGSLPQHGAVELMCHPGYTPVSVKSSYGSQREVELKTFLSSEARQWLEARDLQPTTWWALHPAA
jgi:chitin disaccharide deacetylase